MKAKQLKSDKRNYKKYFNCIRKPLKIGPFESLVDCMLFFLTWKGIKLLKLPISLKSIVLMFRTGCEIGKLKAFKEFWKATVQEDLVRSRNIRSKSWRIFLTVDPLPTDSIPVFGPVQWWPGLLRMSFLSLTIPPTFQKSSTSWDFLFKGLERYWPLPIRRNNLVGSDIPIRILKKSPGRRSWFNL